MASKVTDNIEALIRLVVLNAPMDEETLQVWELDGIDAEYRRSYAIRKLAQLLTPPQPPTTAELMDGLLQLLIAHYPKPVPGQIVDTIYKAEVINNCLRERFINRSISGYTITQRGYDHIKANHESDKPAT